MRTHYVVDPAWSFTWDGDTFMVSGGADQLFALEDVPDDLAGALLAPPVLRPPAPAAGAGIFDQLVMLGALRPEIVAPGRLLATSLVWSGDPVDGVAEGVAAQLGSAELVDGSCSLVVYVRTTATLGETADLAADGPPVAHLLVDAAYHHTLSMGPLVVPGDTACLSCLVMRVWPSWGDERPPPRPAATQRPGLLAAVIAGEIEKVAAGDTGLVNRTVAIDLSAWRTTEGTVLKAPWCPACCPVDAP